MCFLAFIRYLPSKFLKFQLKVLLIDHLIEFSADSLLWESKTSKEFYIFPKSLNKMSLTLRSTIYWFSKKYKHLVYFCVSHFFIIWPTYLLRIFKKNFSNFNSQIEKTDFVEILTERIDLL